MTFDPQKEGVRANLSLKAYYLLGKEPKISFEKPLPELSSSLKKTLGEALGFKAFEFLPTLPADKLGKENPFSFSY